MVWKGILTSLRLTDRLAVRLALLLTVALLPLGIIAVFSSLDSRRTDVRSAERALISLTADTEAGRRALVESAFTTARTLAGPTLERLDDIESCRGLMADTVQQAGVFSFAGFIEVDGLMRCASAGDVQDFSGSAQFTQLLDDPRPVVRRSESGVVSGRPVLIVTDPVFYEGQLRGFLSIGIALRSIAWLRPYRRTEADVRPILFNRFGDVLSTASDAFDPDALLPSGMSLADLARQGGGEIFQGRTEDGAKAVFATAELVRGQLYVLGVWQPDASPTAALVSRRWPALFPLIMWIASIAVVYLALHLLVIRNLRQLGRQMRRFALGDRTLPAAPPRSTSYELREVHATFQKMAALVARDEADLSRALAEKEEILRERTVLLKEVHHRVKNNLQLIASILNLQMRHLQNPHTRRVLQNVQDRVIGLASIHRSLYQSDKLSQLRADTLIDELLRHLFAVGTEAGSGIELQTDLAAVTLEADQLVPLSLLLTEVVTNALKYSGPPADGARPWIRVRLQVDDGTVALDVANSLDPRTKPAREADSDDASSTKLGGELIDAFAMQLGAVLDQGRTKDALGLYWRTSLQFPVAPSSVEIDSDTDGSDSRLRRQT